MTRPQGVFVVLACLLAAAWAARRAGPALSADPAQARPAAAAIASASRPTGFWSRPRAFELDLASPPPFRPPSRNPFRFSEPPATRPFPVPKTRPALTTALVERPERARDETRRDRRGSRARRRHEADGHHQRDGQLIFVKEGERVLGRYEVVRITADAVQLKDPDGETFTIALR